MILRQYTHLLNGNCVELCQTLRLRKTAAYKYSVQVFQI